MKTKTLGRVVGAVNAGAGVFMGSICTYFLSNANYDLISLLSSDLPTTNKIIGSGLALVFGAYLPLSTLMIADGVTDVVKGTHHYFGCRLLQKMERNLEKRREIDSELESQLKRIEETM